MRSIIKILFLAAFAGSLFSCKKINSGMVLVGGGDSTLIFEMDSSIIADNYEQGVFSMLEIPPFDQCALVGSAAYGKDFNIDIVMLSESDSAYIIMSELYDKDEQGNLLWQLTDSVKICFPMGASIGWPGSVVRDGVIDYELMALMPDDKDWIDTEVYDSLLGVWRLDKKSKTIVEEPAHEFSCINESYGVY